MQHLNRARWAAFTVALAAGTVSLAASAQPAGTAATPAPPPGAAAMSLEFHSAFEGYRPFTEEAVRPWKDSNATVEAVGGWKAYAREANDKGSQDRDAKGAPVPAKPSDPHAGHGKP